jgi:hypothetical protein
VRIASDHCTLRRTVSVVIAFLCVLADRRLRLLPLLVGRYIIAPDVEHHMFLPQYASAYPSAKVIGVDGHQAKRKEIKFDGLYGVDPEGTEYGFESEIQAQYFPTFANKDVAFHHIDTRTLITADLLFNLPPNEQYLGTPAGRPTSRIPFLMAIVRRVKPSSWFHKAFLGAAGVAAGIPGVEKGGSKQERRQRFARDAAEVANWDFDRIVMCHGDVIESGGKEAWLEACEKVPARVDDLSVRACVHARVVMTVFLTIALVLSLLPTVPEQGRHSQVLTLPTHLLSFVALFTITQQ